MDARTVSGGARTEIDCGLVPQRFTVPLRWRFEAIDPHTGERSPARTLAVLLPETAAADGGRVLLRLNPESDDNNNANNNANNNNNNNANLVARDGRYTLQYRVGDLSYDAQQPEQRRALADLFAGEESLQAPDETLPAGGVDAAPAAGALWQTCVYGDGLYDAAGQPQARVGTPVDVDLLVVPRVEAHALLSGATLELSVRHSDLFGLPRYAFSLVGTPSADNVEALLAGLTAWRATLLRNSGPYTAESLQAAGALLPDEADVGVQIFMATPPLYDGAAARGEPNGAFAPLTLPLLRTAIGAAKKTQNPRVVDDVLVYLNALWGARREVRTLAVGFGRNAARLERVVRNEGGPEAQAADDAAEDDATKVVLAPVAGLGADFGPGPAAPYAESTSLAGEARVAFLRARAAYEAGTVAATSPRSARNNDQGIYVVEQLSHDGVWRVRAVHLVVVYARVPLQVDTTAAYRDAVALLTPEQRRLAERGGAGDTQRGSAALRGGATTRYEWHRVVALPAAAPMRRSVPEPNLGGADAATVEAARAAEAWRALGLEPAAVAPVPGYGPDAVLRRPAAAGFYALVEVAWPGADADAALYRAVFAGTEQHFLRSLTDTSIALEFGLRRMRVVALVSLAVSARLSSLLLRLDSPQPAPLVIDVAPRLLEAGAGVAVKREGDAAAPPPPQPATVWTHTPFDSAVPQPRAELDGARRLVLVRGAADVGVWTLNYTHIDSVDGKERTDTLFVVVDGWFTCERTQRRVLASAAADWGEARWHTPPPRAVTEVRPGREALLAAARAIEAAMNAARARNLRNYEAERVELRRGVRAQRRAAVAGAAAAAADAEAANDPDYADYEAEAVERLLPATAADARPRAPVTAYELFTTMGYASSADDASFAASLGGDAAANADEAARDAFEESVRQLAGAAAASERGRKRLDGELRAWARAVVARLDALPALLRDAGFVDMTPAGAAAHSLAAPASQRTAEDRRLRGSGPQRDTALFDHDAYVRALPLARLLNGVFNRDVGEAATPATLFAALEPAALPHFDPRRATDRLGVLRGVTPLAPATTWGLVGERFFTLRPWADTVEASSWLASASPHGRPALGRFARNQQVHGAGMRTPWTALTGATLEAAPLAATPYETRTWACCRQPQDAPGCWRGQSRPRAELEALRELDGASLEGADGDVGDLSQMLSVPPQRGTAYAYGIDYDALQTAINAGVLAQDCAGVLALEAEWNRALGGLLRVPFEPRKARMASIARRFLAEAVLALPGAEPRLALPYSEEERQAVAYMVRDLRKGARERDTAPSAQLRYWTFDADAGVPASAGVPRYDAALLRRFGLICEALRRGVEGEKLGLAAATSRLEDEKETLEEAVERSKKAEEERKKAEADAAAAAEAANNAAAAAAAAAATTSASQEQLADAAQDESAASGVLEAARQKAATFVTALSAFLPGQAGRRRAAEAARAAQEEERRAAEAAMRAAAQRKAAADVARAAAEAQLQAAARAAKAEQERAAAAKAAADRKAAEAAAKDAEAAAAKAAAERVAAHNTLLAQRAESIRAKLAAPLLTLITKTAGTIDALTLAFEAPNLETVRRNARVSIDNAADVLRAPRNVAVLRGEVQAAERAYARAIQELVPRVAAINETLTRLDTSAETRMSVGSVDSATQRLVDIDATIERVAAKQVAVEAELALAVANFTKVLERVTYEAREASFLAQPEGNAPPVPQGPAAVTGAPASRPEASELAEAQAAVALAEARLAIHDAAVAVPTSLMGFGAYKEDGLKAFRKAYNAARAPLAAQIRALTRNDVELGGIVTGWRNESRDELEVDVTLARQRLEAAEEAVRLGLGAATGALAAAAGRAADAAQTNDGSPAALAAAAAADDTAVVAETSAAATQAGAAAAQAASDAGAALDAVNREAALWLSVQGSESRRILYALLDIAGGLTTPSIITQDQLAARLPGVAAAALRTYGIATITAALNDVGLSAVKVVGFKRAGDDKPPTKKDGAFLRVWTNDDDAANEKIEFGAAATNAPQAQRSAVATWLTAVAASRRAAERLPAAETAVVAAAAASGLVVAPAPAPASPGPVASAAVLQKVDASLAATAALQAVGGGGGASLAAPAWCYPLTPGEAGALASAGITAPRAAVCQMHATKALKSSRPIKIAGEILKLLVSDLEERLDERRVGARVANLVADVEYMARPRTLFNKTTWAALQAGDVPKRLVNDGDERRFTAREFTLALEIAAGARLRVAEDNYEAARARGDHIVLTAGEAGIEMIELVVPSLRKDAPTGSTGTYEAARDAAAAAMLAALQIVVEKMA